MELSKNFKLKELVASQIADRKGINNNPNEDQINSLKALCENVLQPVRDHFASGEPKKLLEKVKKFKVTK